MCKLLLSTAISWEVFLGVLVVTLKCYGALEIVVLVLLLLFIIIIIIYLFIYLFIFIF